MDFNYSNGTISNVQTLNPGTSPLFISGNIGVVVPSGTTEERGTLVNGQIRYNTSINNIEFAANTQWVSLGSGSGSTITSEAITTALGYTPVNKAGDSMTGNLSLPKTSGSAITIDNAYGWRDLIGDITPRTTVNAPTLATFIGTIREFAYSASDTGDIRFHIPHDYAPGTDLFVHVHWAHNGTNISGTFQTSFNITYAKGHQQSVFTTPVSTSLTVNLLNITNTPQYLHRVDEIQISTAGGSASRINSSLIEVDGLILMNYYTNIIPSISGGTVNKPFVFCIDLHYQSTGISTKNKSPNFYA